MKNLPVTIALSMLSALLVTPASSRILMAGEVLFVSVSNCDFVSSGWRFRSEYVLPENADAKTSISLNWNDGTHGYMLPKGGFGGKLAVVNVEGWSNGEASAYKAAVKVTFSDPPAADVTRTTKFLSIRGAIRDPFNDPGVGGKSCIATFRAAYLQR